MNFIYITIILVLNKEKQLNRLFHSLQDTHQRGSSNASKTFLTPPPFTPPLPDAQYQSVLAGWCSSRSCEKDHFVSMVLYHFECHIFYQ